MATQNTQLIENLNTIYNVKLALKRELGTTSDEFTDYPAYVAALKPFGYMSILSNGQYNVSGFSYAYVSVPAGAGIVPAGTYNITENGQYNIYNYENVEVNIEGVPSGYVLPSGNITLVQNGVVDVSEYATATVSMTVPSGNINLTTNGSHDVSTFSTAIVDVPVPNGYVYPEGILEINSNIIAKDVTSYKYVTVNVPNGGTPPSGNSYIWVGNGIGPESYYEVDVAQYQYAYCSVQESYLTVSNNGSFNVRNIDPSKGFATYLTVNVPDDPEAVSYTYMILGI